jgi:hypothetical protein
MADGARKSMRQLVESVNDTLTGQLDLELHGPRSFDGIAIRVASAYSRWRRGLARRLHRPGGQPITGHLRPCGLAHLDSAVTTNVHSVGCHAAGRAGRTASRRWSIRKVRFSRPA